MCGVYRRAAPPIHAVSDDRLFFAVQFVDLKGQLVDRAAALHRFNTEPSIRALLLATGEANAGLTLVAATSVFIVEP